MENSVSKMQIADLKEIHEHIVEDFLPGEYPPYDALYRHLASGRQEGFILNKGHRKAAYAICAANSKNNYVLISLLAVFDEFRGHGTGTSFLKELIYIYSGKNGIIVEVERPEDSDTEEEKMIRTKRIDFYKKAGFYLIPGIKYSIWGIPLHLMAVTDPDRELLTNEETGRIIYDIYFELLGPGYIHKMEFEITDK